MANGEQEIIDEIENYITGRGGGIRDWYVGIATKPRERLFNDHSVDEKQDSWIYRTASSDRVARDIEKYFLNRGAEGGTAGGDEDSKSVYAYRISWHTRE